MHPASGPAWLVWLETSGLAEAMRRSPWMYPIVEIVHILGFVVLVGSVVMFDLRVLGFGRDLAIRPLASHLLRWAWVGLALVVPAGFMMFMAHATEFADNPAFALKLGLIALAGLNAGFFHRAAHRRATVSSDSARVPAAVRASALISIVVWIGVVVCGRLLAYL